MADNTACNKATVTSVIDWKTFRPLPLISLVTKVNGHHAFATCRNKLREHRLGPSLAEGVRPTELGTVGGLLHPPVRESSRWDLVGELRGGPPERLCNK